MIVLRPAAATDTPRLWRLLEPAADELLGMTSLPRSIDQAELACRATADTVTELAVGSLDLADGGQRSILFVAERVDPDGDAELVGVTGITCKRGVPNLAVQVATSTDGLGLDMASSSVPWTRTELNSSFVAATARGQGLGALVSRGRLMFLQLVARRVPDTVASHLRGRFDPDGTAPFWSCFGGHFAPEWPSSAAAELALAEDPDRLRDLADLVLPLTADVLDSLGPVNRASLPAFRLLMAEGLRPNGMYDPIDGGPTLVARLADTVTGTRRSHGRVQRVEAATADDDALVSLTTIDGFRVVRTRIDRRRAGVVGLVPEAADALGVAPDALVAFITLGGTP